MTGSGNHFVSIWEIYNGIHNILEGPPKLCSYFHKKRMQCVLGSIKVRIINSYLYKGIIEL
jgi:hypothetical protein